MSLRFFASLRFAANDRICLMCHLDPEEHRERDLSEFVEIFPPSSSK